MSKYRLEYVRLRKSGDQAAANPDILAVPLGSGQVIVAGAVSAQAAAAPAFPAEGGFSGGVHARIIGLEGATIVEVGDNPTADQAEGTFVGEGQTVYLPISTGQKVAAIEAVAGALPVGFEYYAETVTPGTYGATALTRTGPGGTFIQTLSYNANGDYTGSSAWVKQ